MSDRPTSAGRRTTAREWIILAAIVAALLALLLPVLQGAREKARRANCNSQLYALGLSFAMYADLYDKRAPDAGPGTTAHDSLNLLSNVTSSGKIFHCPSDRYRTPKAGFTGGDGLGRENRSYGFVSGLCWQDNPDSILMFDRGLTGVTAGSRWRPDSPHGTAGGHQLFLDGHVQFAPTLLHDLEGSAVDLNP